jgi:spore coat protein U-like protein
MRLIAILALAVLALACRAAPAAAVVSCPATIDSISFGNPPSIPPTVGGTISDVLATANVTITCTGGIAVLGIMAPVQVCASIGTGNGGSANSPRVMAGTPAGTLGYQLFTDAARTTVWGTNYGTAFGTVPQITIALNSSGAGSATVQLYAKLPATSMPVAAGSYLSSFTAAHTRFDYGQLSSILGCGLSSILGLTQQANPTFAVSATVDRKCYVNADPIGFGSATTIGADRFANGRVGVRCTPSTTYAVSLDNGLAGTGPTARKMRKLTSPTGEITYGLYRDTPPTLAWGSTVGTDTVAGTGNAAQTDYIVYGKVPAQATPPPGAYSDTIVATVTY